MSLQPITDPRARFWGNLAKWSFAIFGLAILAPVIWLAIGGLLGLILLVVIWTGTWMLRPYVFSVAANLRLKLIKAEAKRNPVETLQEDLRSKTVALDDRRTNILKLNGQIRTFADKVTEIKDKYGAQDSGYVKLNSDLNDLKRIYTHRIQKWNEAKAQLDRFGEEIERASMIWDAAQAAAAAQETSGLTEDDFLARLKTECAFDSIQTSYNEALASLDTAMLDSDGTINVTNSVPAKALPAPATGATVIEVAALSQSKVPVR